MSECICCTIFSGDIVDLVEEELKCISISKIFGKSSRCSTMHKFVGECSRKLPFSITTLRELDSVAVRLVPRSIVQTIVSGDYVV